VSCGKRYSRRKFLSLASIGAIGGVILTKPLHALAAENVREATVFVDDLGRNVWIPHTIQSVTPTGINAQTL
jgi:hypothetical protein